jgi:hypothetical protein
MLKKGMAALALLAALAVPAPAGAHGGHTHNVMGTIASLEGARLAVKATDGKTLTVTLDAKTTITRGKTKVDASALKTGERVSIDYLQEKNANLAKAVKLGTAPAR